MTDAERIISFVEGGGASDTPEMRADSNSESKAVLRSLEGQTAIYLEKFLVQYVRIAEVSLDDWGAKFTLEAISTPGLPLSVPGYTLSGSWEALSVADNSVSAAYVGWLLVTQDELVQRILSVAPDTSNVLDLRDRIFKMVY